VLAVVAKLLDDAFTQMDRAQAPADRGDRRRLLELHLDQRAPGEVEVVTETAMEGERAEPDQREHGRGDVGPLPLADEVVVRVLEELDHAAAPLRIISRWFPPFADPCRADRRASA